MKDRKCQICGNKIPNRIIIDGKLKILSSRKRCLECSPYGNQGRKTGIPGSISKSMTNYKNWPDDWKRQHIEKISQRGRDRKKKIVEGAGGKCIKCNYSGPLRTMSFHHRNPEEKCFGLTTPELSSRTMNEIEKEVLKCDLLCIRCHLELEDEIYTENKLL